MKTEQTNRIVFPRFGECVYQDSEVMEFPWGLPGFNALRKFLVLQVAPTDRFFWLQSIEDVSVALPIGDPWSIFPDYEPNIQPYILQGLKIEQNGDLAIYCVVVVTRNAEEMTMNLLAPIVMNTKLLMGRQVTLEDSSYSVRTPIPRVDVVAQEQAAEQEAV